MALQRRPSWLWITPEITTTLSTGSLVYSLSLADAVARQDRGVSVVGLGHSAPGDLGRSFDPSIRWLPVDGVRRSVVSTLVSRWPHPAAKTATRGLRRRVRELLDQSWDVIVIDGIQSTWVTPLLAERELDSVVMYLSHNHETSMRAEIAAAQQSLARRAVLRYDVARVERLEAKTVEVADVVSAITDRDAERFAADVDDLTSFVVVPPGWSGTYRNDRLPIAERPRRVGIMGSFDWHVKQEGLRRFLAVADPMLADADCELVVGGKVPDEFRRSMEPGLRATRFVGWVDDPGVFLEACRLGVISESLGGGFKLKALDYVFQRVPLACLERCTAGLPLVDGLSMFTAADEEGLAARIVSVIDQPGLLDEVAELAYRKSAGVFDWTASAEKLVAAVETL